MNVTRHYRNRHGMSVSLADIIVAHIALFGERQPSTQPFSEAAERVRNARPADWHKVFDAALAVRVANPELSYELLADALKARLES